MHIAQIRNYIISLGVPAKMIGCSYLTEAVRLAQTDPGKLHDLHMNMPSVSLPEHLDLFEKGIARKIDFSYSGAQSLRMSQLLEDGLLEVAFTMGASSVASSTF